MISLIQSIVSPQIASITTRSSAFTLSVIQGNLIIVSGSYNILPGSFITVTDSLGNAYSINQPVSDTEGNSYWFAYAITLSTGRLTVTLTYSEIVTESSFTSMEFSNDIGWVNPPELDDISFVTGNGVALSSDTIFVTQDDLVISISNATTGSSVTIASPWIFIAQPTPTRAVWWIASTSNLLVSSFLATQTVSGTWEVSTWALKANLFSPNSITIITSSVSPTAFIEVYPNRVKEDIYDSLENQPQFVYVPYGPSFQNG